MLILYREDFDSLTIYYYNEYKELYYWTSISDREVKSLNEKMDVVRRFYDRNYNVIIHDDGEL